MEADQDTLPANINVNTPSVSIQLVPEFNPDAEIAASSATYPLDQLVRGL